MQEVEQLFPRERAEHGVQRALRQCAQLAQRANARDEQGDVRRGDPGKTRQDVEGDDVRGSGGVDRGVDGGRGDRG